MEIKYLDFYLNSKGELINSKLEALTQNSNNYSVRVFTEYKANQVIELAFLKADKSGYRGVYATYKQDKGFYEWKGTKELTNVAPYAKNDLEVTLSIKLDGIVANTIISKVVLYKSLDKYVKEVNYDDNAVSDLSSDLNDLAATVGNNKADVENKLIEQNTDLIERITNGDNVLAGLIDGKANKTDTYTKSEVVGLIENANKGDLDYVAETYVTKEKHNNDVDTLNETIINVNAQTVKDVNAKIDGLIDGAPGALDSLNELAQALGDNPNFATDTIATLASKADKANTYTKENVDIFLGTKVSFIEVAQVELPNIDMWATQNYVDGKVINYVSETLYSKEDVDNRIKDAVGDIVTAETDLSVYAKKENTYTKEEVDNKETSINYRITQNVNGLNDKIDAKANVTDVYDKDTMDDKLDVLVKSIDTKGDANWVERRLETKADIDYVNTYVGAKISNIINSAPEALDTLNELANALGDDPNFATTVSNEIATKASTLYVDGKVTSLTNTMDTLVEGLINDDNAIEAQIVIERNRIDNHANKLADLEDLINNRISTLENYVVPKELRLVTSWHAPSVASGQTVSYSGTINIGKNKRILSNENIKAVYNPKFSSITVSGSQYINYSGQPAPVFIFTYVDLLPEEIIN